MNKPNVSKMIKGVRHVLAKRSPEILTGIGIAGMVTSTVLAVKATPKAWLLIEEARIERHKLTRSVDSYEIPIKQAVQASWKCYIPAAATAVFSITCLIGAHSIHARRNAALAAICKLSETALTEYKTKVIETIGEKKEETVREKIDKDRIDKNPVSKSDVIITEKGNTLCYDSLSGRYFRSDIDRIKKAVNELNRRMIHDMYISLNEFYDELNLDQTILGDSLGWKVDDGLIEVVFSSQIADDGTPCIVINYEIAPRYGYSEFQ